VFLFLLFCASNLAHLKRNIKSRRFAERNIMNRMVLESQVLTALSQAQFDCAVLSKPDYALVNSCTDPGMLFQPKALCRTNSWALSYERHHVGEQLVQVFGHRFLAQRSGLPKDHEWIRFTTKIRIGQWWYSTRVRESRNQQLQTRQSWFFIRAGGIPVLREAAEQIGRIKRNESAEQVEAEVQSLLNKPFIGEFLSFEVLRMKHWAPGGTAQQFWLGRCSLYQPACIDGGEQQSDPITGNFTIDLAQPLKVGLEQLSAHYVLLDAVECPIVLGPESTSARSLKFVAMPVRK